MLARTNTLHLPPISFPGKGTYVVETNPKCEYRAYLGLEAKGFEPFLPKEVVMVSRHRGKRRIVDECERPLFRGYLFVNFDPNEPGWGSIADIDGVKRLLCNGYAENRIPSRVPSGAIEALMRAEGNGVFDFRPKPCGFGKGDNVRVAEGPFASFIGEVLIAKPNKRVQVLLQVFGTRTKAEFYAGELEKL